MKNERYLNTKRQGKIEVRCTSCAINKELLLKMILAKLIETGDPRSHPKGMV